MGRQSSRPISACPDDEWGKSSSAFSSLKDGAQADNDDYIAFRRDNLARFKLPRTVGFGPRPKTSTGKIQKFVPREITQAL